MWQALSRTGAESAGAPILPEIDLLAGLTEGTEI